MTDPTIDFQTDPGRYRHWTLTIEPPRATLTMTVDPAGGLGGDYELKTNSYDLGVDIELYDAVQRLRFEHPDVKVVVVTGGLDKVFCAGANIQMLAGATHEHKVNFCKFTNETRNAIEDASGTPSRSGSRRSTAPPPGAATSWRSPATRSCSSTTAPRRCHCPRSRSSPCSRARAGSPASSTSATSGATSPTPSPRAPKVCVVRRRSTGVSSTGSRRSAASTTRSPIGSASGRQHRTARTRRRGVELTPLERSIRRRLRDAIAMSTSPSIASSGRRRSRSPHLPGPSPPPPTSYSTSALSRGSSRTARRARRRDSPPAAQRDRRRHVVLPHDRGERRRRPRRGRPRRPSEPLAGARSPAAVDAHARSASTSRRARW